MTTPVKGAPDLSVSQASKEATHNEANRYLEQGADYYVVVDKDLTAPPGTCANGACYIVGGSPTGAWSGQAGKLAVAVGANASNGWLFIAPREGTRAYLQDENGEYQHNGTSWAGVAAGLTVAVTSQSGTSYTAVIGDANGYITFTSASPVTFTVPPNSSVAFPVGTSITIEQAGAGAVTVAPGSGVTVRSRGGLTGIAGQYGVAQLVQVAADVWTLTGDLV